MSDYIDRAALGIDFCRWNVFENKSYVDGWNAAIKILKEAPAADVQEIKHGKWIETQEPLGWCDIDCAECSVCHESWIIDEDSSIDDYECMWHYCPNCGAKMDGENNNA
jgi:hypothetical protein